MSERKRYPTDLTDTQWARIEPHLPRRTSPPGRKRIHSPREILNAILYVLRTGCPWRMLPHDFPAWKTVYPSFRRWRRDGTQERLNAALRAAQGQAAEPRGVIVDSQSVKTTARGLTRLGWGQAHVGAKALAGSGQRRADSCGSGAPSGCA